MTLITDVLARAARQCSIDEPSSWLSTTDEDHVALRDDILLEAVDDILERIDLPSPIGAQQVITGDGTEDYSLNSNFKRLQRDPLAVYETTNRRACIPVTDDGTWSHIGAIGTAGVERYYRLEGYDGNWTISFFQNPGTGISITASYITTNWMAANGTAGSAFTDSADVLLLPRRAVELGTVLRFRERNGLDPSSARLAYEAELNRLSNDRRVRRSVNFGEPESRVTPWDVPDFIPMS